MSEFSAERAVIYGRIPYTLRDISKNGVNWKPRIRQKQKDNTN